MFTAWAYVGLFELMDCGTYETEEEAAEALAEEWEDQRRALEIDFSDEELEEMEERFWAESQIMEE